MLKPNLLLVPLPSHWVWVAIVIETMALLSWIAYAATRGIKFAFFFGFNVMLPVACMNLAAGGRLNWRAAFAAISVAVYLLNMNLVILFWARDTAMSKLDRTLRPVEKLVLPFLMANASGWLYCLPFRFRPPDGTSGLARRVCTRRLHCRYSHSLRRGLAEEALQSEAGNERACCSTRASGATVATRTTSATRSSTLAGHSSPQIRGPGCRPP